MEGGGEGGSHDHQWNHQKHVAAVLFYVSAAEYQSKHRAQSADQTGPSKTSWQLDTDCRAAVEYKLLPYICSQAAESTEHID